MDRRGEGKTGVQMPAKATGLAAAGIHDGLRARGCAHHLHPHVIFKREQLQSTADRRRNGSSERFSTWPRDTQVGTGKV